MKQKQKYRGLFSKLSIFLLSYYFVVSSLLLMVKSGRELVQTVIVVIVLHGFNFTKKVTISNLREEVVVGSSC
ncbi:hypothetical protein AZK38_10295 [Streptococcus pneumoniae]|uniref:Uncharacterized protein n=1 Tax=Streptococcus pneumoniae TaxID=1313 RepID=A0A5C8R5C1_STREE|nr:hypothetical protein AZK38_10295 [Streptococcus pneumoniae]TVV55857.1 hypothetical protein AZK37_09775 [Streptococcus pneumoniae]TVV69652.1 hypothetical protein AZK30_09755 [Streptococcus pneumoniae]TVV86759.1 hypothetical protein AZK22_10120 [Streptococcus pneumoniae]TVW00338.1 hypothetical protein AZK15_05290 [Streptococcus pneumoniae]